MEVEARSTTGGVASAVHRDNDVPFPGHDKRFVD